MTKREFLESRGYEYIRTYTYSVFVKQFNNSHVNIYLTSSPIASCFEVVSEIALRNQKDIDALQIDFNNGKRDFEEMMECED